VIVLVILALAVFGGATWLSQNHPVAADRPVHRRLTAGLLSASAAVLLAAVVWAVVVRP
jgi:hypothetical protein